MYVTDTYKKLSRFSGVVLPFVPNIDAKSDPSASDGEDFIRTRYSEYTGTSSDPYLDITYTPRPSVIQYNFM